MKKPDLDEFGLAFAGNIPAVHHDARVNETADGVAARNRIGTHEGKATHPRTQAHIFLLPQTKRGLLVNMTDGANPGRDSLRQDLIQEVVTNYWSHLNLEIHHLSLRMNLLVDPAWDALFREAALSTMEEFYSAAPITDARAARQFGLDKFASHLRSLDRQELRKRHEARRDQFHRYTITNQAQLRANLANCIKEEGEMLRGQLDRRARLISELQDRYKSSSPLTPVRFWDLPHPKVLMVYREGHPYSLSLSANRAPAINRTTARSCLSRFPVQVRPANVHCRSHSSTKISFGHEVHSRVDIHLT